MDRRSIEQLATCDFVRRHENVILVGQTGLGKSRIIQAVTDFGTRHRCPPSDAEIKSVLSRRHGIDACVDRSRAPQALVSRPPPPGARA